MTTPHTPPPKPFDDDEQQIKAPPALGAAHVRLDRIFEYAFTVFLGIAILGSTGDYSIAAGVLLPGYWLFLRNQRLDELQQALDAAPNVAYQPRPTEPL